MIIGRLTAQFGKTASGSTPSTSTAARARRSRSRPRVPQPRRRLDRPRQQRRAVPVAGSDVHRRARLLRRAVLSESGVRGRWWRTASCCSRPATRAFRYNPIFGHPPPDGITNLIPVTEQSNADQSGHRPAYAPQPNYTYRGVQSWGWAVGKTDGWQASGVVRHRRAQLKVGYQGNRLDQLDQTIANQTQLGYRFNQGVPNAVSYWLPDFGRRTITTLHGVFVQDSWTRGRLTLQGALRYDRASSYAPVERNGTTNTSFLNPRRSPSRRRRASTPTTTSRRAWASPYDVFGNGKTALKFNWGKYLAYAANDSPYTSTNPGFTIVREVLRTADGTRSLAAGGNGDLVVNCNLLNPAANGECAAATGTAPNFGKAGAAHRGRSRRAERLGRAAERPPVHHHGAAGAVPAGVCGLQLHAPKLPRLLRHRRPQPPQNGVASYYETYTLTAPQDSRLADGGGYPVTVYVPTAAANAVAPRLYPDARDRPRPGARQRVGRLRVHGERAAAERPDHRRSARHRPRAGRHLRDRRRHYNNVNAGAGDDPRPRPARLPQRRAVADGAARPGELHDPEDRRARQRHRSARSRRCSSAASTVLTGNTSAQWQVPNSVIAAALGHLPPGATATGNTTIPLGRQRSPRLLGRAADADRHALREDPALRPHPPDVGVDLNNLLNTNYATGSTRPTSTTPTTRRGRAGWGTPASIYNPRFVRLNFTLNF